MEHETESHLNQILSDPGVEGSSVSRVVTQSAIEECGGGNKRETFCHRQLIAKAGEKARPDCVFDPGWTRCPEIGKAASALEKEGSPRTRVERKNNGGVPDEVIEGAYAFGPAVPLQTEEESRAEGQTKVEVAGKGAFPAE